MFSLFISSSIVLLFLICYNFQTKEYPNEHYNVYLDGEYLEGETSDHIELFEKLSKKMGYDNFQEFCEQNPDAKFITGKTKKPKTKNN